MQIRSKMERSVMLGKLASMASMANPLGGRLRCNWLRKVIGNLIFKILCNYTFACWKKDIEFSPHLVDMGGKLSRNRCRHYRSASYVYGPSSIQGSSPCHSHRSYSIEHGGSDIRSSYSFDGRSNMQARSSRMNNYYTSLEQVTEALIHAGLESSNLIVGIDFTKSNDWTGARSFHRKSLHHLGDTPNPYEQTISIFGRTLSAFDDDNLIHCYGFGDATTNDQEVFSFYPDDKSCYGFEGVLARYRELVPEIKLAGPTSFAPIIETAIEIVDNSCGQYHVLVIIADGQVTRSIDISDGELSPQEQRTINAIVKASEYPLSIVLVGVGDGPWDMIHNLNNNIPSRAFENFQFVNFTEIMSEHILTSRKEAKFALDALKKIPLQYKTALGLRLLGCQRGTPGKFPLPPPNGNSHHTDFRPNSNEQRNGFHYSPAPNSSPRSICSVCLCGKKDLAFGCGHQTCCDCSEKLIACPICRSYITTRIRLYDCE